MNRRVIALASVIVLAGCTDVIHMRNPATGQLAHCGPYYSDGWSNDETTMREARCLNDYMRQGFQRVAD